MLIFYKIQDNHFFVVGYAKNEQENLNLLCAEGILIEIITGE